MAQHTQSITLSSEWSEIASGKTTVLVQRIEVTEIRLFVGDAKPAVGDKGHVLASGALKTASFDGLPGTKVWGRVVNVVPETTAEIVVTAF